MKVLFYSILKYTRNFSLLLFFSCQLLLADWPRHRGDAALTGRSESKLGNKLDLLWTYETGEFLKSSVVVENGFAYVGSDDGDSSMQSIFQRVSPNGLLKQRWPLKPRHYFTKVK